jgi:hypothetical protein
MVVRRVSAGVGPVNGNWLLSPYGEPRYSDPYHFGDFAF